MRATPFEIMLVNLRGYMPVPNCRVSRAKAYEELKRISGVDLGYDDKLWEEWGFDNEHLVNPPFFLRLFRNLEGRVSNQSLYFMPRENAYEELKKLTGEDFGDDIERWRKWGIEHGHLREP